MQHKLFGIDLDGTLLSKNKKISIQNLRAINRYINAGGTPVITTGRSFVSARTYARVIEDYTQTKLAYLIAFNGAYIHDLKNNKITKSVIDTHITNEIWDLAIKNKCGIWVYPCEHKYERIVYANKKWLAIFAKSSREVQLQKKHGKLNSSSYKINIMSLSSKKIKAIHQHLIHKYGDNIEISYTHPLLLEITKKNINKGYALSKVANQLKITKKHIAAIGDSGNDVSMFRISDLSIGLKSSCPELRKSVDVYFKYKENAVAEAINEHLIKEEIELIVSDLDGTLLDDYTKLAHNETRKYVKRAVKEKKCKFAIATGRGLDDALLVYKNLKLKPHDNLYVIGTNGAFIYDCTNKVYLCKNYVDPKLAEKLCDCYYKIQNSKHIGKMGIQIYTDQDSFHDKGDPYKLHLVNKDVVLNSMKTKTPYFLINNWAEKEYVDLFNGTINYDKIFKIVFFCDNETDKARLHGLILSKKFPLEVSSSGSDNLEIMANKVCKGNAVKFLATYLKIDDNNVLTVGDERNDISMLKQFKNSVTLKSSKLDVQEAAHYVINAKPSEIVKKAIQKLVFHNEQ